MSSSSSMVSKEIIDTHEEENKNQVEAKPVVTEETVVKAVMKKMPTWFMSEFKFIPDPTKKEDPNAPFV